MIKYVLKVKSKCDDNIRDSITSKSYEKIKQCFYECVESKLFVYLSIVKLNEETIIEFKRGNK